GREHRAVETGALLRTIGLERGPHRLEGAIQRGGRDDAAGAEALLELGDGEPREGRVVERELGATRLRGTRDGYGRRRRGGRSRADRRRRSRRRGRTRPEVADRE